MEVHRMGRRKRKKKSKFSLGMLLIIIIPIFIALFARDNQPSIKGEAAIVIDGETGRIIYSKNIHEKMYPASTTKLMTAILLEENKSPEDTLVYSKDAQLQEPRNLFLPVGTKISADNSMDALLIYSANDIAYMVGENISGSSDEFVKLMNEKAEEMNLKDTHFENPSGLPNDNHYSTAYDLALIAKKAYDYPWIMEAINKESSYIKTENKEIDFVIDNTNVLLNRNGCIGGKTGYTDGAGKCLVAFYERGGRKRIGVVLKSKDDITVFEDMEKIIDWSYNPVGKFLKKIWSS